jgi:hypothetical protein
MGTSTMTYTDEELQVINWFNSLIPAMRETMETHIRILPADSIVRKDAEDVFYRVIDRLQRFGHHG